jgi:tol-pal system protein YbgF
MNLFHFGKRTISVVAFSMLSSFISADQVPVVDLSPSQNQASSSADTGDRQANQFSLGGETLSLSTRERLSRLEQQMANLTAMNMPQQISDLQEKVQQLNGQLQVQSHDLKLLNQQQRSFYKDLDDRINQLSNLSNSNGMGHSDKVLSDSKGPTTQQPAIKHKTTQPHSTVHPSSQSLPSNDVKTYQSAFSLLSKKQYLGAKQGMQSYIDKHPSGKYAANAHYWLGEINMHQDQKNDAINAFNTVIREFPKSNKVPDALLKLGMLDQQAGNRSQALSFFHQLKKQYPSSTAAQLANIYIQQLGA